MSELILHHYGESPCSSVDRTSSAAVSGLPVGLEEMFPSLALFPAGSEGLCFMTKFWPDRLPSLAAIPVRFSRIGRRSGWNRARRSAAKIGLVSGSRGPKSSVFPLTAATKAV